MIRARNRLLSVAKRKKLLSLARLLCNFKSIVIQHLVSILLIILIKVKPVQNMTVFQLAKPFFNIFSSTLRPSRDDRLYAK